MIRRPPRSTQSRSSAASDVYKRQGLLQRAAALLPGRRDFSALTPSAHLYHSCVREVLTAGWRSAAGDDGPPGSAEWVFTITAGSFLHNMVRVAVSSMIWLVVRSVATPLMNFLPISGSLVMLDGWAIFFCRACTKACWRAARVKSSSA